MTISLGKDFSLKINIYIAALTLIVFVLLITLGMWQLDRGVEKDNRIKQMAVYQQQEATNLNAILSMQQGKELLNDLSVKLSGTFDNLQVFLLDNQVHNGKLGYRVIQIFQDQSSASSVLVNLGWLQGSIDRNFIPEVNPIVGPVSFKGKIRIIESSIVLEEDTLQPRNWPQRIQAIDIQKISALLGKNLLPFVIYLDNEETIGYIKNWTPIVMPPEKHRAYAFQWFTLALAWILLMVSAAYKAGKKNSNETRP